MSVKVEKCGVSDIVTITEPGSQSAIRKIQMTPVEAMSLIGELAEALGCTVTITPKA